MARHAITRQKLRCHDGHWEFADFALAPLGPERYGMVVHCDYGDHWLRESPDGTMTYSWEEYAWPSAVKAFEMRDRWEQQEAGAHPEETAP